MKFTFLARVFSVLISIFISCRSVEVLKESRFENGVMVTSFVFRSMNVVVD